MNSDRIWTLFARKLAGEISPEELAELEVFLKADPHLHLKIQSTEEFWINDNSPDDTTNKEIAYQRLTGKLQDLGYLILSSEDAEACMELPAFKKRSHKIRTLIAVAAIAMIAGVSTYYMFFRAGEENHSPLVPSSISTISTKYGSRPSKIELPDGSVVWLNSGSQLTYDKQFGNTHREVNLTGEGFFDVIHNAEKPFIIHTTFYDIKDLGTRFNVKCYPNDKVTETSLVEGRVEITAKKRPQEPPYTLIPNNKYVLPNEELNSDSIKVITGKKPRHVEELTEPLLKKLTYQAEDSFSVETAWTYNILSFEDDLFIEAVKKMERWFDRKIEIRNKELEDLHVTGSFTIESFEQVIEALKYTYRFKYYTKDKQVTIY